MFVFNELNPDARVFKEAKTLTEAGHDVRVIGFLDKATVPYEERDGFRINRVALDPIPVKALRLVLLLVGFVKKPFSSVWRESKSILSRADVDEVPVDSPKGHVGASLENATDNRRYSAGDFVSVFYPLVMIRRLWYRILRWLLMKVPYIYLHYPDYYFRSFRLARQEPADVYHAHDLNTLPVAWLCSRLSKAKLVYDSHELWLDRTRIPPRSNFNRFLVKRIESFLIRRTDANITVGESVGRELAERYHIIKPTVILNVPPYRSVERSRLLRVDIGIPTDDRIILYIGIINMLRGLEEAVQSLKYLNHCRLVLMGFAYEHYVPVLEEFIAKEGLTGRVHFFGPVPFEEVTRYAASADVGLVAYRNVGLSYYYSSPNKLFECVAAGLPVVGSNFPDLKGIIEGYNLGVTCDPDNPKEIADAINYILSDETRYNEMRRNALEAAKIFNWENESRKLVVLYEGLNGRLVDAAF